MRFSRRRNGVVLSIVISALVGALVACGGPATGNRSQVEQGRALYAANCQVCHGIAATGQGAVGYAPSNGPDGHTWHHADGQLTDIILGRMNSPGRTMPSFESVLSDSDVSAILAFLKTGWLDEQKESQRIASEKWNLFQRGR